MTYRGHIKNGVVVMDEPSALPEGTEVWVDVPDSPASTEHEKLAMAGARLAAKVGAPDEFADWEAAGA